MLSSMIYSQAHMEATHLSVKQPYQ